MGFKCGIVGLPNVGKSTLFNAMTNAGIQAANYPFCTIEPNVANAIVPDVRIDALAKIVNPERIVPTILQLVDIAGIVEGASKGEGLGNQFLANIRETEAIAHVVRCFDNTDIVHVAGKINPIHDIEIINTELTLADLDTVERAMLRAEKQSRSGDKDGIFLKETLSKIRPHLEAGHVMRKLTLTDKEHDAIRQLHLLTAKPVLYIANIDDTGYENNPYLQQVIEHAQAENAKVVAVSAATEAELVELDEEDRQELMADLGMKEPGLNRIIRAGYELLGLQTYFTAGVKEVRAWTIPQGATAPQAAGVIHTDFEKGFIRAQVIAYDDFIHYKGEQGAKLAGKLRSEGKEYVVADGDVLHFLFNV